MEMGSRHASLDDMQIRNNFIAPLLLAAGVAVGIAAAPTAMAASGAPARPCTNGVCPDGHTTLAGPLPGNTQLNDSPPVDFAPQYPYWEGGYGGYGGYGHGGFGGGFGGGHGGGGHR